MWFCHSPGIEIPTWQACGRLSACADKFDKEK
jgi:hypothetical protein